MRTHDPFFPLGRFKLAPVEKKYFDRIPDCQQKKKKINKKIGNK